MEEDADGTNFKKAVGNRNHRRWDSERCGEEKAALSEETESQCKEFDAVLEKETDAKIRDIRNELEKEKDSRLAALKEDTEQHLVHLDSFYKENHQRISEELFKKIITA